jgi:hypothetical protein
VNREGRVFILTRPIALALLLGATACDDGTSPRTGLTEPIRVRGGQWVPGDLPEGEAGPAVLTVNSLDNLIQKGASGKRFSGNAARGATTIAVRFKHIGSGYWITPVGTPDPQIEGALTWEVVVDFAQNIQPGRHPLTFAAVNTAGAFGPSSELPLFVASSVPEGKVVISLAWDSPADLDLHLIAPNGKELDPKHVTTSAADSTDGGADALPAGTGVLDRDSNAACIEDGLRAENVVFADAPLPGKYRIRVNMFSACRAAAANFVVTVRRDAAIVFVQKGRLLDLDADGGGFGAGLAVGEISF